MFLILSKVLDIFLAPLTWALLLGVAGAFGQRRRPRLARVLQIAGLGVLYGFSLQPVANFLMWHLEASAQNTFQQGKRYDVVIVLGGGLDATATENSGEPEFNDAPERLLRGYELLLEGRAQNVLLSGGSLEPHPGGVVEAKVLAAQLQAWGIDPQHIFIEEKSRNTHENAVESSQVVSAQGWRTLLLVTSAAHMARARECFHAVGIYPDTFAVDHRAFPGKLKGFRWQPRVVHLNQSTEGLREFAGRLIYRMQGYAKP